MRILPHAKKIQTIIAGLVAALSLILFLYCRQVTSETSAPSPVVLPNAEQLSFLKPSHHKIDQTVLSAIVPKITLGQAVITASSSKAFAYAHATVEADGKFFIGMADKDGNLFPPNELLIFNEKADGISSPIAVSLPNKGDIETMVYDQKNDTVYFLLSSNGGLWIYGLDPNTYTTRVIASTTAIDAGRKPAIVTDGSYIYGITNTDQSTVWKVSIHGGAIISSSVGHIPNGHSAAIGVYGSNSTGSGRTELYFGGGMQNGFEKADASTLKSIATETIEPCSMSDDMPFVNDSGYVYIGCETVPYGIRVRTSDMSYDRFALPGASLGLFVFDNDLYNAAQDGAIDIFPGRDLTDLHRYKLSNANAFMDTKGLDPEVNEILYPAESSDLAGQPAVGKFYITAWYGIPGLFQVSTSTLK